MTSEVKEAISNLKELKKDVRMHTLPHIADIIIKSLDMAIEALEIVNDFERAQIITGGRLNGRTHAYKCGLADGQRLAKGEKLLNILPLKQTDKIEKSNFSTEQYKADLQGAYDCGYAKALEQQPCEDCVDRDEVLKLVVQYPHIIGNRYSGLMTDIKKLPPVTPQRPKGKWIEIEIDVGEFIYKCTKCGMRVINPYKYCPNCGAEMSGGGEE